MNPNMECNHFPIHHFVRIYTCNSKTTGRMPTFYILNDCSTIGDVFLCVSRGGCKILMARYASNVYHSLIPISHFWIYSVLRHKTWKFEVICGHSAHWTTPILSETFFVVFRFALEIQLESYIVQPETCIGSSLIRHCVHILQAHTCIYISIWKVTTPDNKTHIPCECILHTKRRFYCQGCIVL